MRSISEKMLFGALALLAISPAQANPLRGGFPTGGGGGFGGFPTGGGGGFSGFPTGGGGGFGGFPGLPTSTSSAAPAPTGGSGSGAACSSYTIIEARGTGEPQGPSMGFRTMNQQILSRVSGGKEYDVVYPAGIDQQSSQGTTDVSV